MVSAPSVGKVVVNTQFYAQRPVAFSWVGRSYKVNHATQSHLLPVCLGPRRRLALLLVVRVLGGFADWAQPLLRIAIMHACLGACMPMFALPPFFQQLPKGGREGSQPPPHLSP